MATIAEPESLLKDATLIVDVCMSVEKDDVVTIICDDDHAGAGRRDRGGRASSAARGRSS